MNTISKESGGDADEEKNWKGKEKIDLNIKRRKKGLILKKKIKRERRKIKKNRNKIT